MTEIQLPLFAFQSFVGQPRSPASIESQYSPFAFSQATFGMSASQPDEAAAAAAYPYPYSHISLPHQSVRPRPTIDTIRPGAYLDAAQAAFASWEDESATPVAPQPPMQTLAQAVLPVPRAQRSADQVKPDWLTFADEPAFDYQMLDEESGLSRKGSTKSTQSSSSASSAASISSSQHDSSSPSSRDSTSTARHRKAARSRSIGSSSSGHAVMVNGERRYPCTFEGCDQTFSRRYNMTTHLSSTHFRNKPYPCPVKSCTKTFSRRHDLGRHLAAVHESAEPLPTTVKLTSMRRDTSGRSSRSLSSASAPSPRSEHSTSSPQSSADASPASSIDRMLTQAYGSVGIKSEVDEIDEALRYIPVPSELEHAHASFAAFANPFAGHYQAQSAPVTSVEPGFALAQNPHEQDTLTAQFALPEGAFPSQASQFGMQFY
ncbi:hypothetical protein E5Q_01124 [Mixia osmundae IAM 14324]|uniref:C2H2-type domain-containing protein n=1 Tax=Mixia osmundae (strain CBS 9802 / IAM 14324 / JCM 22182 / KY 12970) TaxID=764103 RepID=G7DV62_MIXOS|nr:hypothetical protein E5Q_01124 [Mixia osmundae IAM 14324]